SSSKHLPGSHDRGNDLRTERGDHICTLRADSVAPRSARELRRLHHPAPKNVDRIGLTDSILFHLVERVVREDHLTARENGSEKLLGFSGPERLFQRRHGDYGPSIDIKSTSGSTHSHARG